MQRLQYGADKNRMMGCAPQLTPNQWFVDHWWTVHPEYRMHPMDACFSDVYLFEKFSIEFIQHFGRTWFIENSEAVNPVMGRVVGKIHGLSMNLDSGEVRTTDLDPNYHSRLIEVLESEIPLVYAVEVKDEPPINSSPRHSTCSEDSLTPSMVSYLERADYWDQYDWPRAAERFPCEYVDLDDHYEEGDTVGSSEAEWNSWLAEAYSLDSGSSRRRRKFGLK